MRENSPRELLSRWTFTIRANEDSQRLVPAIVRLLAGFGLTPAGIWAAEHVYTIYNRRFESMQMISVFAAEADADAVRLEPNEHAQSRWCSFDEALGLVNYRGLKDGLRSAREFVTGLDTPAAELRLL